MASKAEVDANVAAGYAEQGILLTAAGPLAHKGTTVGFYNATPVTKPTALTAADAAAVDVTYGAEEAGVIANLRTRVNELETKLRALGLLA